MSKEFEKQMVLWAAADLQKRNDCKAVINKIFEQILQANSALRQYIAEQGLSFTNFKSMLTEYQQALIEEVDFLPIEYMAEKSNHPLRAAVALSNLNVAQSPMAFSLNLGHFTKEANDSHFYPRAKAFAAAIIIGFVFAGVCALMLYSFNAGKNLIGIVSAFVGLYVADDTHSANNNRFRPIYAAKDAGNRLSRFFSNPKPHLAVETSEKSGLVSSVSVENAVKQEDHHVEPPPAYVQPSASMAL